MSDEPETLSVKSLLLFVPFLLRGEIEFARAIDDVFIIFCSVCILNSFSRVSVAILVIFFSWPWTCCSMRWNYSRITSPKTVSSSITISTLQSYRYFISAGPISSSILLFLLNSNFKFFNLGLFHYLMGFWGFGVLGFWADAFFRHL